MLTIYNLSSQRQRRWVSTFIPDHPETHEQGFLDGFPYALGARRGDHRELLLYAELDGDEERYIDGEFTQGILQPAISRFAPDPSAIALQLHVDRERIDLKLIRADQTGFHRTRIHLRGVLQGFVADVWCDVFSWQDVVDICGRIVYCGEGKGRDARVYLACASGIFDVDQQSDDGNEFSSWQIGPTAAHHAANAAFCFYGIWRPVLDETERRRRPFVEAATGGPLTGFKSLMAVRRVVIEAMQEQYHFCEETGSRRRFSERGEQTNGLAPVSYKPAIRDEDRDDEVLARLLNVVNDPLVAYDLLDRLELDLSRENRGKQGSTLGDARLMRCWLASVQSTMDTKAKAKWESLMSETFMAWEKELHTPTGIVPRTANLPVMPARVVSTIDERVLEGGPCWKPCEEAELAEAMFNYHLHIDNDQILDFVNSIRSNIARFGTVHGAEGVLYPLEAVLWLPNGEVPPPSYYTFPRKGASFGDDAYDMRVGLPSSTDRIWFPTDAEREDFERAAVSASASDQPPGLKQ